MPIEPLPKNEIIEQATEPQTTEEDPTTLVSERSENPLEPVLSDGVPVADFGKRITPQSESDSASLADLLSDNASFVTAQERPETVSREDHYALGGPQFPMRRPPRNLADAQRALNPDTNRVQFLDISRKFPLYHLFSGPATLAPGELQETVAGAGSDAIAVQQLTDAGIAGHTVFASRRIKHSYERSLSEMLAKSSGELRATSEDILTKHKNQIAEYERKLSEYEKQLIDSKEQPAKREEMLAKYKDQMVKFFKDVRSREDTSRSLSLAKMLTRTPEGKVQFDMDAVYQIAKREEYVNDPKKAAEARARLDASEKNLPTPISSDAKNILLADYIAHDVHGKKQDRAAYEFIRTSLGLAATGTFIAATHGASLIGEGVVHGLRTAGGLGVTGVSFRPDVLGRNMKFRYRGQKQARIENLHQEERDRFAQENKAGFQVQDEGLRSLESVPKEAIQAVCEGPMKEKIVRQVNGEQIGVWRLSASRMNEKKSPQAKAERRDFITKYAYEVLKHEMGVNHPDSVATFRAILAESNGAGLRKQDASFRKLIQRDPHLETAFQFLQDLGANKEGAIQCLRETMQAEVKKELSTDPRTALLSGTEDYNPNSAGAGVIGRMKQAGASRGV